MLSQLRFGRGVDNRRYRATGFRYRYTSRETVLKLGEHMRLHPIVRGAQEPYRYEREVEEFLRWSPHVKTARDKASGRSHGDRGGALGDAEDRLTAAEQRAEAAEQTGLTTHTLRYYERDGLMLGSVERSSSGSSQGSCNVISVRSAV